MQTFTKIYGDEDSPVDWWDFDFQDHYVNNEELN